MEEEAELRLGRNCRYSYASTDTLLIPVTSTLSLPTSPRPSSSSSFSRVTVHRKCSLGQRLRRRQDALQQRKKLVYVSFLLAMTGIMLVVINTELCLAKVLSQDSYCSLTLQGLTSLSTGCLLLVILAYHVTGLRLHLSTSGLQEWRLAVWNINWWQLTFELLVCALHPLPFITFDLPTSIVKVGSGGRQEVKQASLPLNGVLTIVMFLRLYLLGRLVVVHSKLFLDTCVQTVGAVSRVQIKAGFVFRAVMSTCPMAVLGSWMVSTFFINTWNLRLCEVYTDPDSDHAQLGQSMWLTAVTFLTVGYGDVVPRSSCARLIASFTGLMGVGSMALSVAVLAKKLEQPRAEKYVHTFVRQIELDKRRRHAAADVVKQAFRIVRDMHKGKAPHSALIVRHRSRMFRAVRAMHVAQFHKASLADVRVGAVEVQTGVSGLQESVDSMQAEQRQLAQRVRRLQNLAVGVSNQLADIKQLLKDK